MEIIKNIEEIVQMFGPGFIVGKIASPYNGVQIASVLYRGVDYGKIILVQNKRILESCAYIGKHYLIHDRRVILALQRNEDGNYFRGDLNPIDFLGFEPLSSKEELPEKIKAFEFLKTKKMLSG